MDSLGEGGGYTTKVQLSNEVAPGYLVEGLFQINEQHKGLDPGMVPGSCLSVGLFFVFGNLYYLGQVDEVILT